MTWLARRADSLIGTVLSAVVGLAALQVPAFIRQYLQRLGGHADEARRQAEAIATNDLYQTLEPAARQALLTASEARLAALEAARDAIATAGPFTRTPEFFLNLNADIARAALTDFAPALPLEAAALVHGLIGLLIGWILYDLVKWPLRLAGRAVGRSRRTG